MASKIKVLVVDDEEDLLEVSALNIEIEGHEVFTASSGNNALKFLDTTDVDLVISDIRMADGDGVYLLEEIQKRESNIPVILLVTGFSELSREEALKKGARDLLDKPTDFDLINKIIEEISPE